ncbi:MAG: hypothetical protein KA138_05200 [Saprospiraceae bacterium]|nr:hypothetical protein [Saprospiraceae bacterium]
MRQTKLIETLQTLSIRERNRWRQYVWSDFCNRHKTLRVLCDAMLAMALRFDEVMEKRALFAQIFGSETPYQELKFNNLLSDLYQLLLDWMALERYWADPLEQQRHCVRALLDRHLDRQAASALEKYRMLLDQAPQRNAEWYRHAAILEEASETLHSRQPRRADSPHLFRQAQCTHQAHSLEKLRLGVALRSRSQLAVMQSGEHAFLFNDLNTIRLDEDLLQTLPVARAYLAAYHLLETPSAETFETLTSRLEEHHELFEKDELASLYQIALNHCIRRINAGQTDAYADALVLYRTLLERGLLLQHGGRLSQWAYKNIATTGLRTGAFEWTEQFLNQYREALPPTERDNAFAFNLATLYFEKQELALTLQTLQNVNFTDFTYHVGAKILQLKTFYLLNEDDALISLLATTEQLLRRDKTLSSFGKSTNLNFLKMLRQASKWKSKKPRLSLQKSERERLALLEKVVALQPVANKDWLLKILGREE